MVIFFPRKIRRIAERHSKLYVDSDARKSEAKFLNVRLQDIQSAHLPVDDEDNRVVVLIYIVDLNCSSPRKAVHRSGFQVEISNGAFGSFPALFDFSKLRPLFPDPRTWNSGLARNGLSCIAYASWKIENKRVI